MLHATVLMPLEQVEVEYLFTGCHQAHVERLPADDPHGSERELERLAGDHVRLVVARQPPTLPLPQPWETVGAMGGHQHSVEPLDLFRPYPVLLVDLTLFDERRRVEIGQRGKAIPVDLALEHDVAALRVERVHAPQHDCAVGAVVGEQVGEPGAVLGRELVAERRKSGCVHLLGLDSVRSRQQRHTVAVDRLPLPLPTHEIAWIEFMIS